MHLLFLDESGTPPKPEAPSPKYFVVGGIIIPEAVWHPLREAFMGLKIRHKIRGELKWRYFAPGNSDDKNPLRSVPQDQRNIIRSDLYKIISQNKSIRTLGCIVSSAAAYKMDSVSSQDDIYFLGYKGITERFQYFLQDISTVAGSKQYGIIIGDHRGVADDRALRSYHQKLLYSTGEFHSTYGNLIEGLFLEP